MKKTVFAKVLNGVFGLLAWLRHAKECLGSGRATASAAVALIVLLIRVFVGLATTSRSDQAKGLKDLKSLIEFLVVELGYPLALGLALLSIVLFIKSIYKMTGKEFGYRVATEYDDLYVEARRLAAGAKRRILIVNLWPYDKPAGGKQDAVENGYYTELERFVNRGGTLVRVLQLPVDTDGTLREVEIGKLQEWFGGGYHRTNLVAHIREMVKWRDDETHPKNVAILAVPMMSTSTFVVYDEEKVLLPVYEGNPFRGHKANMKMTGMFTISDTTKGLVQPFLDLYARISAHAIPVEEKFLKKLPGSPGNKAPGYVFSVRRPAPRRTRRLAAAVRALCRTSSREGPAPILGSSHTAGRSRPTQGD